MKQIWSEMGGKLGVGMIAAGFLLIFLGWNGAASVDRIQSQFPYLISGGLAGMSLVICGIGLIVVQNQREDRAQLQQTVRELREAMAEAGIASSTGSTRTEFHLPTPRPTPPEQGAEPAEAAATDHDDDVPVSDDETEAIELVPDDADASDDDDDSPRRRRKLRANQT